MTRVALGVYRSRYGYRVIWRDRGRQQEKRFPADTPLAALKAFRAQQVKQASADTQDRSGSFPRDVVRFLKTRRGRPSFKADRAHLRAWVHRFRRASRWSLTPAQITDAIGEWQIAGYSPQTLKHRLRILRALYRTLDGPTTRTPCDGVILPRIPKRRPISVPATIIQEVALQLRRREMADGRFSPKTRARYLILATTGQRPAQLMRAQPFDVDLEARRWTVRPAKGDQGTVLALNDEMIAAWELFIAAKAWGAYSQRSFVTTLHRNGWPKQIRVYNLRHTMGLALSEHGTDLGDIQAWLGHSDPRMTRVYVPAVSQRLAAASARVEGRLPVSALSPVPARSASQRRGVKRRTLEKTGLSKSGRQSSDPPGSGHPTRKSA